MTTAWSVYIIQCGDGSLYTGIARDVDRRLRQHGTQTDAKYTRNRGPFVLIHEEKFDLRGLAQRREAEIKSLPRTEKLRLASTAQEAI